MSQKDVIVNLKSIIRSKDAEIERLRETLHRLTKRFEAARDGAEDWFHETGNVYHQGRLVAYAQAAADVRGVLQGESNG